MAGSISLCAQNFVSFIRMIGSAPSGAFMWLPDGTVAGASGLNDAEDNYALFADGAKLKQAASVVRFFDERKLPFMAPLFYGSRPELIRALERQGLAWSGFHTAMALSLSCFDGERGEDVVKVSSESELAAWTVATWRGFDGAGEPDAAYVTFSRYLARCSENALYYLKENGEAVCAGLLLQNAETVGLYYFATPPEYRRRGYAKRLLVSLAREAAKWSETLVLLATDAGLPAYKSLGFETIAHLSMMRRVTE